MRNDKLADMILHWAEMDIADLEKCLYDDLVGNVAYQAGVSENRVRREIARLETNGYLFVSGGEVTVTDKQREEDMADSVRKLTATVPKCHICGKSVTDCGHLTGELEEQLILDACITK